MGYFQRYAALLEHLYLARTERRLTMQQEHAIACDLESLWAKLTEMEKNQIEELTEKHKYREVP
jgi:hypothetical protein